MQGVPYRCHAIDSDFGEFPFPVVPAVWATSLFSSLPPRVRVCRAVDEFIVTSEPTAMLDCAH